MLLNVELQVIQLKGLPYFFFLATRQACGILVPQPGIEPAPPAVEAWNLNHGTAREVPKGFPYFELHMVP